MYCAELLYLSCIKATRVVNKLKNKTKKMEKVKQVLKQELKKENSFKSKMSISIIILLLYAIIILMMSSCGSSKSYDCNRHHYGQSCVR